MDFADGTIAQRVPAGASRVGQETPEIISFSRGPLAQRVVAHKLRGRQRLSLTPRGDVAIFEVADGVGLVEVAFDRERPQIPTIVFPGDVVTVSALPFLARASIICASKLGIVLERPMAGEGDLVTDQFMVAEMSYNVARATLQSTILANLPSEERVATLLTEFALRCGRPFAGGCIFEMPLARTDVALYLGLNPDTVSRCITALKSEGVIKTYGRSSMSCQDFGALVARSPMADVLKQMLAKRRSPAA